MNTPESLLTNLLSCEWVSPISTGIELMRRTIPDNFRQFPAIARIFPQFPPTPCYWNVGSSAEHWYDKNAMYLSACSMSLPVGRLWVQSGELPYYALSYSGLFHVKQWLKSPDTRIHPHEEPELKKEYMYTPMIQYFHKRGIQPIIDQWWLFPESRPVLLKWYKLLREVRETLLSCNTVSRETTQEAYFLFKRLYVATLGCLDHPTDKKDHLYMPHWYYLIQEQAKANLFYNILKVWQNSGRLPVSIKVDAIGYTVPVDLPLGAGLGQYKYVSRETVERHGER